MNSLHLYFADRTSGFALPALLIKQAHLKPDQSELKLTSGTKWLKIDITALKALAKAAERFQTTFQLILSTDAEDNVQFQLKAIKDEIRPHNPPLKMRDVFKACSIISKELEASGFKAQADYIEDMKFKLPNGHGVESEDYAGEFTAFRNTPAKTTKAITLDFTN